MSDKTIIGDEVELAFSALGNVKIHGKVDTGADNSCLHATDIQVNTDKNTVSFRCEPLSDNIITMDLDGTQEVLSADGGAGTRPIICMDVSINDIPLQKVSFNLNDRSDMDSPILVGQNIIKTGNFIIDINQEETPTDIHESSDEDKKTDNTKTSDSVDSKPTESDKSELTKEAEIVEAIKTLKRHNVSIFELVEYLRTAPLYLR